jgi:hypothetical protein
MDDGMRTGATTTRGGQSQGRPASRHMRVDDAPDGTGATLEERGDVLGSKGVVPVLLCLLAAMLLTVLVCLVHVPKYAAIDDFMQALYARGAYFDTPSHLMQYSMVLFSAPVSLLYAAIPLVPWYPVTLMGLQVVSFAAMFNLARKMRTSVLVRVFALVALGLCELMVTTYFTFSVAGLVTFAAGMSIVLAHGCFAPPKSLLPSDALGYLLIVMGVSIRYDVCFAAALVFLPFLIWAIVRNRNQLTFIMAAGVVACIVLSYVAGQAAWRSGQGWEGYVDMQEAASSVADYPRVSYDDAHRVAPKLSENDVDMIYDFLFVDAETYDLETFRALDGVVQPFGVSTFVSAVRSRLSFTAFSLGLVVVAFLFAVLLAVARGFNGRGKALLFGVCAATLALMLLLLLRARARMHVVLPLFVATVFALVVGALNDDEAAVGHASARLHAALPVAGMAVFAAVLAFVEVSYARPLQRSLSSELTPNMQRYVEAHPDTLVAFTYSQGGLLNYDAFAFDRWRHPQNAVFIGGYDYYTKPWENFLARSGLSRDRFLEYLLDGDRMVTIGGERQAKLVETYLSEHTGKTVRAERVESMGKATQSPEEHFVWKYTTVEQ